MAHPCGDPRPIPGSGGGVGQGIHCRSHSCEAHGEANRALDLGKGAMGPHAAIPDGVPLAPAVAGKHALALLRSLVEGLKACDPDSDAEMADLAKSIADVAKTLLAGPACLFDPATTALLCEECGHEHTTAEPCGDAEPCEEE